MKNNENCSSCRKFRCFILLKGVTKTIKNETKEQKGRFLSMLSGTLGARVLGDLLTRNLSGKGFIRAGEGTITVLSCHQYLVELVFFCI